MERLKTRAENQGKCVSVSNDGILSIDGVDKLGRTRGFINRQLSDEHMNRDGQS